MHSVEIADSDDRRAEIGWNLVQTAKYAESRRHLVVVPHGNFETVIGEANVRRQCAFRLSMRQVMADVGEERPARRELLDGLDRALDGGMRWVRLVAQRVQK